MIKSLEDILPKLNSILESNPNSGIISTDGEVIKTEDILYHLERMHTLDQLSKTHDVYWFPLHPGSVTYRIVSNYSNITHSVDYTSARIVKGQVDHIEIHNGITWYSICEGPNIVGIFVPITEWKKTVFDNEEDAQAELSRIQWEV